MKNNTFTNKHFQLGACVVSYATSIDSACNESEMPMMMDLIQVEKQPHVVDLRQVEKQPHDHQTTSGHGAATAQS